MSIWCSHGGVGWDDLDEKFESGEVRAYANGWSNHYPSADVEVVASIGLASVPAYCVPGHNQSGKDFHCDNCGEYHDAYPERGEWLRLDLNAPGALTWWTKDGENPTPEPVHASLVMDESAARALAAELLAWAERPVVTADPEATP